MTAAPTWLDYSVRWRSGDAHPGRHKARHAGEGGSLRGYRPFWQAPDARRIDVRRSIMDIAGDIMVRQMESRGSLTLVIAADLSRSMGNEPGTLSDVADLVEAASRSTGRTGDALGVIGFDAQIVEKFACAPARARGPALEMAARLRGLRPEGRSADGIATLPARLPAKRCLVLLVSDFRMKLTLVKAALEGLGRHDVAPIVLHGAQRPMLPSYGLVRIEDSESRERRLLLMRPALRTRLAQEAAAWRAQLDELFLAHCRPAYHATGLLDVAALSRHLLVT